MNDYGEFVDLLGVFNQFQAQVQAAIIAGAFALLGISINIYVSRRYLKKSHNINEKNLEIAQKKFEQEIQKILKEENNNFIDHKLKMLKEIERKKSGISELRKKILSLNTLTPDQPFFYNSLKEKSGGSVDFWCDRQEDLAKKFLEELNIVAIENLDNTEEKNFCESVSNVALSNYNMFFNIIKLYYSNVPPQQKYLPSVRSARLWNYAKDILKSNNEVIKFLELWLSNLFKNLDVSKDRDLDLKYINGSLPLCKRTNESLDEAKEMLLSKVPKMVDFKGYEDYEREEKMDEYTMAKNSGDNFKVATLCVDPIIFENVDQSEWLRVLDQVGNIIIQEKLHWLLEHACDNNWIDVSEKISFLLWDETYDRIVFNLSTCENDQLKSEFVNLMGKNKVYRQKILESIKKSDSKNVSWMLQDV